jgi:Fuc2NAc and GlcNAc transferase
MRLPRRWRCSAASQLRVCGFLGYTLAGSALWASREFGVPVWTWLILGSVFIADATVTLVRRVCRGERWHAAHRSHAYQHLARRWRSHARVSGLVLVLDTLVMLPLGLLSVLERRWSFGLAIGTLVVVMTATLLAGAGRAEAPAQGS